MNLERIDAIIDLMPEEDAKAFLGMVSADPRLNFENRLITFSLFGVLIISTLTATLLLDYFPPRTVGRACIIVFPIAVTYLYARYHGKIRGWCYDQAVVRHASISDFFK